MSAISARFSSRFFFFNDTAPTEIYTLSLHDALPILQRWRCHFIQREVARVRIGLLSPLRSEEHTSELQSQSNLVCRLLLEKQKVVKYNVLDIKKKIYEDDKTKNATGK